MSCLLLLAVLPIGAAHPAPGQRPPVAEGTFTAWKTYRDARPQDTRLARYYPLDNAGGTGGSFPPLSGDPATPLVFTPVPVSGATATAIRSVPGRWPQKEAFRLDQGCLSTPAPVVRDRSFSAAIWFRLNGQGAHRGNDGATNGMLLCAGNGYFDGWRVTVRNPSHRLALEIGGPTGSVGSNVLTEPVAEGVWHHLTVTWNGSDARLSLDGVPAATFAYQGEYTPPANGQLRIGYADSGIGSEILDVDEVALFDRALSPPEIVQEALFYARLSGQQAASWAAADAALDGGNAAKAEQLLLPLLQDRAMDAGARAAVRLRLGAALRRQNRPREAASRLLPLLDAPGIATRIARQAEGDLLGVVRESSGTIFPRPLYQRLLATPSLRFPDRFALLLALGNAQAAAGDLVAARTTFLRIADSGEASPAAKSIAWQCIGRAALRAKRYPLAQTAFEQIGSLPGVPAYDRVEAAERLAEIRQRSSGKPEQDTAGRTSLPLSPKPGVTFYVAPDGRDANDGTALHPFASLVRARDAIRAARKNGALPRGGVAVVIRGGNYRVTDTLTLTAEDSGTPEAPIVYRAAPGETPVFEGGAVVRDFRPVTDPALLARLPADISGRVYQADLKAQGISDFGAFEPGGFASARGFTTHPLLELFFDGKPMPLAGWPNEGYIRIAGVESGSPHTFSYTEDRPGRWKEEKDGWLYGYWFFDWADSYEKIGAIDSTRKTIALAPPATVYGDGANGLKAGQRFRGINLLSEIDQPGEWYLDRSSGVLIFYPPADPNRARITVSLFRSPFVHLVNVSHVTLAGLLFQHGQGDGIRIDGGDSCLIHGCTLRRLGGNALEIAGGTHHGVLSCDLHTLGRGGAVISGGDRTTLRPGGHFLENCHIHHYSRIDHTYTPAILMSGVGSRIAHNLIHDAYSSALRIEGNDHRIEYNEVRDVVQESDDQGASDMWADPTYRGNVFRYNYWHDIGGNAAVGRAGIRLDDFISGMVIYGNIFARCSGGNFGAIQINQGRDNLIENNVFFDCKTALSGGAGSPEVWQRYLTGAMGKNFLTRVRIAAPPYSTRYPELKTLETEASNRMQRNLLLRCASTVPEHRIEALDNRESAANPGFVAPERGDFTLAPGAALHNWLSFQPIPFAQIGLYRDRYRTLNRP